MVRVILEAVQNSTVFHESPWFLCIVVLVLLASWILDSIIGMKN